MAFLTPPRAELSCTSFYAFLMPLRPELSTNQGYFMMPPHRHGQEMEKMAVFDPPLG